MAAGDSSRDDVAIERRRSAVVSFVAVVVVLSVLALGGALGWGAASMSAIVVGSLIFAYLAAAAQLDGPRNAALAKRVSEVPGEGAEHSSIMILDAFPDPVIIARGASRVEAVNAAARRMFGPRLGAGPLTALVREPRVLDAVRQAIDHAAAGEVEYKETSSPERFLRAVVAPYPSEDDAVRRAILVIRDESAVKQAEQARADFLANASHELRTPLASLMGFVETLRGHARDDEQARERFLGVISDQAERMRRLIDDLLSLSRIEQTERLTPTDPVNLADVAGDVVDALAPLAADRRIALEIGQEVEDTCVLGDRDELVQVVQNLVENAVKYSDAGGRVVVDVGVAASAHDVAAGGGPLAGGAVRLTLLQPEIRPDAEYAWLRVTDTGRGIERRHLPRLSERFFRGDSDVAASVEGTGLGLAIVRHVMARHRGGLTVESAVGVGSRFAISAPYHNREETGGGAQDGRGASLDRRSKPEQA